MTRRALAGVAAAVFAAWLLLGGDGGTYAAFTDSSTVASGNFTAGSLNASTASVPTQADGTAQLAMTWTAATLTTGGTGTATATSYDVVRYSAATGGTAVGTVCSGVTTTSCSFDAAATPAYYGVKARFESWTKDSARVTWNDGVGPVVAHTRPVDGASMAVTAMRTHVAGCGANAIACGTAADLPGPVATVQYTLRRTGFLANGACWNGTAWVTATTCTYAATTGTTSWNVPGSPTTAYVANLGGFASYTYALSIRSTDAAGNVTTSSITYTTT